MSVGRSIVLLVAMMIGTARADHPHRVAREVKVPAWAPPKPGCDLKVPDFTSSQSRRRSDLRVPLELARTDLHVPDFGE
jgi:hypothetical protein